MSGITNPAEEYFKDGLWAWATNTWEKLVSSGGILYNALHGWDGDSWQKLPMLWGFSGTVAEDAGGAAPSAGLITLHSSTARAGEVWVIENIGARNDTTNSTRLVIYATVDAVVTRLYDADPGDVGVSAIWGGRVRLGDGDKISVMYYDSLEDDALKFRFCGYKMKIAE